MPQELRVEAEHAQTLPLQMEETNVLALDLIQNLVTLEIVQVCFTRRDCGRDCINSNMLLITMSKMKANVSKILYSF